MPRGTRTSSGAISAPRPSAMQSRNVAPPKAVPRAMSAAPRWPAASPTATFSASAPERMTLATNGATQRGGRQADEPIEQAFGGHDDDDHARRKCCQRQQRGHRATLFSNAEGAKPGRL